MNAARRGFLTSLMIAVALLASMAGVTRAQDPTGAEPLELRDGDRVVLLGGTFIERAQRYGWLETAMQLRFPDRKFTVRNLGWSGDTVFAESRGIFDPPAKGYERMIAQVLELKPTVILLHYGDNESFEGAEYIDTFIRQYEKLLDDLKPTGARMVLISPMHRIALPAPLPDVTAQDAMVEVYVEAVYKLALQRKLACIVVPDLAQESAAAGISAEILSDDGLHFTDRGYQFASERLVDLMFGLSRPQGLVVHGRFGQTLECTNTGTGGPCPIEMLTSSDTRVSFRVKRSGGAGGVDSVHLDLTGTGQFEVKVNGQAQERVTGEQLTAADNAALPRVFLYDELRQTVIDKSQLYFYRWRPQNVTYLFLFRKHEQGNNAKEVDDFIPLIDALDQKIFDLKRQAGEVTVEIVRVPEGT